MKHRHPKRTLLKYSFMNGCLCAGLIACSSSLVPKIGEIETDNISLSQHAMTKHLAAALETSNITLGELVAAKEAIQIQEAPDPTALLQSMATIDDQRTFSRSSDLAVLSYNVALLDAKLIGLISLRQSPYLEERREILADLIFSSSHDVICIQELWHAEDTKLFSEIAASYGFLSFVTNRQESNDGLAIFIRSSIMSGGTAPLFTQTVYDVQDGVEFWPGPGIRRGFMRVEFIHKNIGRTIVYNTHMQAFPDQWHNRLVQARHMGYDISSSTSDEDIVIVAGDLNAGAYYQKASWEYPDGKKEDHWWHNTFSYPALLAYGQLSDAVMMSRSIEDAALEVIEGQKVVNNPNTALEIPGGVEDYCASVHPLAFTATDCNTLYFEQYAGEEYPARLDHIHVTSRNDRIKARESSIFMREKIMFQNVEVEPSDHYGVSILLEVADEPK
jgi:endonuclease/exonuclease/phosphatase family metal-dependent hydrolase